MAKLARVILPGYLHHIIQRGNRRQVVFFCDDDYIFYLGLLKEWSNNESIEILAYCLMTNHVHLILNARSRFQFIKSHHRNTWSIHAHD